MVDERLKRVGIIKPMPEGPFPFSARAAPVQQAGDYGSDAGCDKDRNTKIESHEKFPGKRDAPSRGW